MRARRGKVLARRKSSCLTSRKMTCKALRSLIETNPLASAQSRTPTCKPLIWLHSRTPIGCATCTSATILTPKHPWQASSTTSLARICSTLTANSSRQLTRPWACAQATRAQWTVQLGTEKQGPPLKSSPTSEMLLTSKWSNMAWERGTRPRPHKIKEAQTKGGKSSLKVAARRLTIAGRRGLTDKAVVLLPWLITAHRCLEGPTPTGTARTLSQSSVSWIQKILIWPILATINSMLMVTAINRVLAREAWTT